MKKHVPDPPPYTCPVFTPDKAFNTATEYLNKAIDALDRLPDYVVLEKIPDLSGAIVDLKIGRAFLRVAMENSPM